MVMVVMMVVLSRPVGGERLLQQAARVTLVALALRSLAALLRALG